VREDREAKRTIKIERATLVRTVLIALGLWALANLLWLSRDILFLGLFAVLLATFLSIFVDPLERAGARRGVVAPLVLLLFLAMGAVVARMLWPTLVDQLLLLQEEVPRRLSQIGSWFEQQYTSILGPSEQDGMEERLRTQLLTGATGLVSGTLPLLTTLVGALSAALIVMFAAVYMTVDPRHYRDGLVRLAPPQHRPLLSETLNDVAGTMRKWLIATLISMAIIAAMTTTGLLLLGIPAALALGLIAGLLQFVPTVGPIVSAVPAAVVALVVSPLHVLWVILLYLVTQQIESNMITPIVMRRAVDLPPALTLLTQALMTVLFGFLGLLLAVPLVAITMVLVRRLYVERMEAEVMTR
jgi:predicted PurR-regulated permease PerM